MATSMATSMVLTKFISLLAMRGIAAFTITLGVNIALGLLAPSVHAQAPAASVWPTKPVKFVVPFPAGSPPDYAIRSITERLASRWGQPVLVENRPGASGIIGVNTALQAPADGHTFLFAQGSALSIVPRTVKGVQFDYKRDFVPVALAAIAPIVLAVRADDELNKFEDLIALAKAQPEKIDMGNPGKATIPHLAAEVIGLNAKVKFYPIYFQGGPAAVAALLGKNIRVVVDGYGAVQSQVAAGKLKVLAVMADQVYPGLEAFALTTRVVPDTAVMGWFGVYARKGTEEAVVAKVNADMNAALNSPDIVAKFREIGTYIKSGPPAALDAFTVSEQKFWAEKLEALGIKPE